MKGDGRKRNHFTLLGAAYEDSSSTIRAQSIKVEKTTSDLSSCEGMRAVREVLGNKAMAREDADYCANFCFACGNSWPQVGFKPCTEDK